MCGLVGVAGEIYQQEKKAFRNLLFLDIKRGEHSTGVASIKKDDNISIYKSVGTPFDLYTEHKNSFDDKDHIIKDFNLKVLLGHNRFATMGAHTSENAHPFHHGNIVGAHNGTMDKAWLHKLDDYSKFEVDSEAIFYGINKNGLEDTIGRMTNAWALTYYNAEEKRMNFIRNSARPLYFCWTKGRRSFFWASEAWMLEQSLEWAGIEIEEKIFQFRSDIHYFLDLGEKGELGAKANLIYEEDKIEGFQPPVRNHPHSWSPYGSNFYQNETKIEEGTKGNVVKLPIKNETDHDKIIMKSLIGKSIDVMFCNVTISSNGAEYIEAQSPDPVHNFTVRLYGAGSKKWDEWCKDIGESYYTIKVKKYVNRVSKGKRELYLLADLRSVSDRTPFEEYWEAFGNEDGTLDCCGVDDSIPFDVAPKKEDIDGNGLDKLALYFGYKGEQLTYTQFIERTNKGCEWCAEVPNEETLDGIKFFNKDHFMCGLCNKNGEISMYMKQFGDEYGE
jgi:predicted glutamine amidotransferase